MGIINPENVEFVFDNADGTSTVGIGYDEPDGKGNFIHKVRSEVVSRREGNQIAKMLKKKQDDILKIQKKSGAKPPPTPKEAHLLDRPPPKIFRAPNGRPIDLQDVMKVKKKV